MRFPGSTCRPQRASTAFAAKFPLPYLRSLSIVDTMRIQGSGPCLHALRVTLVLHGTPFPGCSRIHRIRGKCADRHVREFIALRLAGYIVMSVFLLDARSMESASIRHFTSSRTKRVCTYLMGHDRAAITKHWHQRCAFAVSPWANNRNSEATTATT